VVLEEKLIDKLELVLRELVQAGHRADRVVVLSGFRAPYYNERGSGEGMARASRHQYGDAADIIIDSNGDGQMDDLNGDRRLDLRDVGPITSAIERIEQQYPEFVGRTRRWDREVHSRTWMCAGRARGGRKRREREAPLRRRDRTISRLTDSPPGLR
jgi:hypothetical protein